MKRLFIFTFSLLLFEIGYALDVPDFMMVPKSTWVAAFPELNKADIQTEIATAPQDANLGLRLVHLRSRIKRQGARPRPLEKIVSLNQATFF